MSWYVDKGGRQVWVDRTETVYTVAEPGEATLPVETLAYCSVSSNKAIYAEHMIDDDLGGRGAKKKEKMAGRQRGYVVRMDKGSMGDSRVTGSMQAVMAHLQDKGVLNRVDVDEDFGMPVRRGKKEKKQEAAEKAAREARGEEEKPEKPEEPVVEMIPIGCNECRLETTARCVHQAHGKGFNLVVLEDDGKQRLHCFVASEFKGMPVKEWNRHLVAAVEATGSRAVLGRMIKDEPGPGEVDSKGKKKDLVALEEDDWMASVMGRCMVSSDKDKVKKEAAGEGAKGEGEEAAAANPDDIPPWLKPRKRRVPVPE